MQNLKQKAASGVKWEMVSKVLQKVLSVGAFAILARILEPETFGLFAMAFLLIDGLSILESMGLDSGVIQKKECSQATKDTAFYLIQACGVVICLLCYAVAPIAGYFFKTPEVPSVIRALGILFIVSGFGRVPKALLAKDLKFRLSSIAQLIGAFVNAACAILITLKWPSVWALVWAYVIKQVVISTLFWLFSGYRFSWKFDLQAAKELFSFGKFMVGMSLLWYFLSNLNKMVVGKILGVVSLGYFALASNIGNFINTHFTHLLAKVLFPAYSSIQDDPQALKRAYVKSIKLISLVSFPFSVSLICLAEEFVVFLYGPKWLDIIPLIQIFGVIQFVAPIAAVCEPVFLGCGKPNYSFRLTLFSIIARIPVLIFCTLKWGIVGTALGELIIRYLAAPFYFILARKVTLVTWKEIGASILTSLICASLMFAAMSGLKWVLAESSWAFFHAHALFQLLLFSMLGGSVYLLAFRLIEPSSASEVKRLIFR